MRNRRVLVGRNAELDELATAIDRARAATSQVVVIRGEAGVGKTALLEAAIGEAADVRAVKLAGIEREIDLTMAGLFELSRRLADVHAELAPQHAQRLSEAMAGNVDRGVVDRFGLGVAVLALLSAAAERETLLVAIDDAQWLDQPSRDALLFAARRMDAERVVLLMTVRDGEHDAAFADLPGLELGPLGEHDATLVMQRATAHRLPTAAARRVLELAAGNPLALVELPRLLRDGSETEPLLVHGRLQDAFGRRIADLPEESQQALRVAACSYDESIGPVLAACARMGLPAGCLSAAEDAALVDLAGDRIVFRHPLIRAAIVTKTSTSERRAIHATLADIFDPSRDLEQRARHLAAAAVGFDDGAADLLDRVARDALDRGAFAAASEVFERSAGLTTDGDRRAVRWLHAAEVAGPAGDLGRAAALIERGLADATSAVTRARGWHARCQLASFGFPVTPEIVARVADEAALVENDDPALAVEMLVDSAMVATTLFGKRDIAPAVAAALAARAAGNDAAVAARAAALVVMSGAGGLPGAASDPSTRAALAAELSPAALAHLFTNVALSFGFVEDNEATAEISQWLVEHLRRQGALGSLPFPLCLVGNAAFLCGRWHEAHLAATEAAELAALAGEHVMVMFADMVHTLVSAGRGWEADCRDRAAGVLASAEVIGAAGIRITTLWALGLLELGLGRADAAIERLMALAEDEDNLMNGPGTTKWHPDLIEALVDCGRADEAHRILGRLERESEERNSAFGHAASRRARALLGHAENVDTAFQGAIADFTTSGDRFETARTEFAWGGRLLRDGRAADAALHLKRALRDFEWLEAEGWAGRARARLEEAGAELARPGKHLSAVLTPRQLRVALAAANGLAPADVASRLFLSPSTVRRELERARDATGVVDIAALLDTVRAAGLGAPARAEDSAVSIALFGTFRVAVGDRRIDCLGRLPELALKAVAAAGGDLGVEELAETLWPGEAEGVARARLRNVLWRLRDVIGPALERQGDRLRLSSAVSVDALRFDQESREAVDRHRAGDAAAAAVAAAAISRYRGPFLADEPYEEWATSPRERFARRYLELLDILAADAADHGQVADAVRLLDRAIEADPYDEERYVRAARLVREQGRVAVALSYVERAEAVAIDLAIPLSPVLRSLRAELQAV